MSSSNSESLAQIAKRSRVRGLRAMLVASFALAAIAFGAADATAAAGVVLGGMAGALGFWSMSVRLERIVTAQPDRLPVATTLWTYYRLAIYAIFLGVAYRLDTQQLHALLGALVGLFSTRFVVLYLAITDSRRPSAEKH